MTASVEPIRPGSPFSDQVRLVTNAPGELTPRDLTAFFSHIVTKELSPVFIAFIESRHLFLNEAYMALHGVPPRSAEAIEEHFALLRPEIEEILPELDGPPNRRTRLRTVVSGGETKQFRVTYAKILDPQGKLQAVSGVYTDVTSLVVVTEQLRDSEDMLADIVRAASDWIWKTDRAGTLIFVSDRITDVVGFPAELLIGRDLLALADGRDDTGEVDELHRALERRSPFRALPVTLQDLTGAARQHVLSGVPYFDKQSGEFSGFRGTGSDVSRQCAAEYAARDLAYYDPLTRLPNRRLLMDRLRQGLAAAARTGREGALLFVDLDNFKMLNDTLGHHAGDLLLQEVARRLVSCIRESDTAARLGGDEFVIMLEDLSDTPGDSAARAKIVGEKILATVGQPFDLGDQEYHTTPSIGITLFGTSEREGVEDLLQQADLAMYQAKTAGRNALRFYDPELQAAVKARADLEKDLRQGIRNGEFIVHFQPQIDRYQLIGAEALVRWQHPKRGLVLPGKFIPLAEETGLIQPLGHWVLETTCERIAAWEAWLEKADVTLAVNVSARQFRQTGFVEEVLAILDRTNANPKYLKLELTESMLVDNVEDIIAKMTELQSHGLTFALDDFGTGYSSLSYLKRLPLSQLKIDRSFVTDVLTDANDAVIARTIIALGQNLGLKVIAEGVETSAQQEFLARNGCHAHQGFLFSQPLSVEAFQSELESAAKLAGEPGLAWGAGGADPEAAEADLPQLSA